MVARKYCYTRELLHLNQCPSLVRLPEDLQMVKTPFVAAVWAEALRGYRDHKYVGYLVLGIPHGFYIGYMGEHALQSAKSKMGSA